MDQLSSGTLTWLGRAIPICRTPATISAGGKSLADALNLDWPGIYKKLSPRGRILQSVLDQRGAMQPQVMIPLQYLEELYGPTVAPFVIEARRFACGDAVASVIEEMFQTLRSDISKLRQDMAQVSAGQATVSQDVSSIRTAKGSLWSISDYISYRGIKPMPQEESYHMGREATKFSRAANLPTGEEAIGQGKRRTYTAAAIKQAYQIIFGVELEEDANS